MDTRLLEENATTQTKHCLELLQDIFKDDLLGVYLYGSSVVGNLQRFSDLDLFVVTARPSNKEEKSRLAQELLSISGVYRSAEKRPIEITVVVQHDVTPWKYPPSFDFQYGEWLRSKFQTGNCEPWEITVSPDLAVLITQVLLASRTLYGEEPRNVLAEVPYTDFVTALTDSLDDLYRELDSDTRNVLLTLARIWMTVETSSITSKTKAASWAIKHSPSHLQSAIQRAQASAAGEVEESWDDLGGTIKECAEYMLEKIKERVGTIKRGDISVGQITLCE